MINMIIGLVIWTSVTVVFVRGEIFTTVKDLILMATPGAVLEELVASLLYCAQCSGFWIGFLGSFIIWPFWIVTDMTFMVPVLNGFCVSFSATIVDRLLYGREED